MVTACVQQQVINVKGIKSPCALQMLHVEVACAVVPLMFAACAVHG